MKNITNYYKNKIPIMGRQIDSKISYTIEGTTTELGKEQLNSDTPHYESQILKSTMKQLDIDSNVDIPLNTTLNYQFGVKIHEPYDEPFDIKGNTTQSGTPTPSNPVPVVNKTGHITETINNEEYEFDLGDIELCKIGNYQDSIKKSTGKNLFDYTNTNNYVNSGNSSLTKIDGGIRISTTNQGTNRFASYVLGEYSNFAGKTITISGNIIPSSTNNSAWQLWYMNSSKGLISQINTESYGNFTKTLTTTPPNNTYYR